MRITRVFSFFLLQLLEKYPKLKRPIDSIKNIAHIFLGWLYWKYKTGSEYVRVYRFNLTTRKIQDPTSWLNFKNFPLLTFLAVATSLVAFTIDRELNKLIVDIVPGINLPLEEAKSIVGLYLSAVNTVVGITISLFTIGFQIASNYSERVKNYALGNISNRIISPFFFVVVFNFSTLILISTSSQLPRIAFLLSTGLTTYSLYLVYFLVDKIIYGPQARYLFKKVFSEIKENILIASSVDRYTYSSWSIIQNSRHFIMLLLRVQDDLFNDLKRLDDGREALIYINAIGEELRFYSNKRRYIDTKRPWWFPQEYVQASASDPVMYPIKANYEIRGTGPLFIPKPDWYWFEDLIIEKIKNLVSGLEDKFDPNTASAIIKSMDIILSGDYQKDKLGKPQKVITGTFEDQEFHLFDKVWNLFCKLFDLVKDDDSLFVEYLNSLFSIALVVIDGYKLKELHAHVDRLITSEGRLGISRDEIKSLLLPRVAREIVIDYWERLEVEVETEGKIITPRKWLKEEIEQEYKKKITPYVEKYTNSLVAHSNNILQKFYKDKKYGRVAQILKLQLEWVSRMIYLNKWNDAEKLSESMKVSLAFLVNLPSEVVVETELREQVEKGLLPALIKRNKKLYDFYLRAFLIIFIFLRSQEKDSEKIIRLMRIPVAVGGLAYLVSELDQEPFFVTQLMKYLEGILSVKGTAAEVLELAKDIRKYLDIGQNFRLIEDEANRYRGYYRMVIDEVHRLPEGWEQGRGEFGFNKTVKHPSRFIRRVGAWELFDMYECMDDFVEWVKFREEMKKLVQLLNQIQHDRSK